MANTSVLEETRSSASGATAPKSPATLRRSAIVLTLIEAFRIQANGRPPYIFKREIREALKVLIHLYRTGGLSLEGICERDFDANYDGTSYFTLSFLLAVHGDALIRCQPNLPNNDEYYITTFMEVYAEAHLNCLTKDEQNFLRKSGRIACDLYVQNGRNASAAIESLSRFQP
jgi:hypothetical protein